MGTRQIFLLALCGLLVCVPGVCLAQQTTAEGTQTPPQAPNPGDPDQTAIPQDPSAAVPPVPAHTGLGALVYTTWDDFKSFPRRRSTWVILGIGAGAAMAAHPADTDLNDHLAGSRAVGRFWAPGKYVGSVYAQVGLSVGLYTIGRYAIPPSTGEAKTNKWSHMGFDLLRAQILSQALVQGLKQATQRDRPTGGCCSFPSGHAATAFATASVIERHFGYRMAWPTMVAATYVATSRLHDNRHYLSDVLFGSALGIATGWTVVGRHGRSNYALTPVAMPGGFALEITRVNVGAARSGGMR